MCHLTRPIFCLKVSELRPNILSKTEVRDLKHETRTFYLCGCVCVYFSVC